MLKPNTIHTLHLLDGLKKLPDESVNMVITSPPYWNLRDYGKSTDAVWDGNPKCKHLFGKPIRRRKTGGGEKCLIAIHRKGIGHYDSKSRFCKKCGAWKGQLGLLPPRVAAACGFARQARDLVRSWPTSCEAASGKPRALRQNACRFVVLNHYNGARSGREQLTCAPTWGDQT